MVVWNVTADDIIVRQAADADNVWPAQTKEDAAIFPLLKRGVQVVPSKWVQDGLLEFANIKAGSQTITARFSSRLFSLVPIAPQDRKNLHPPA